MASALDLAFNKAIFGIRYDPLTSRRDVLSVFPSKLHSGIRFDPPIVCCCISAIFIGMGGCHSSGRIVL